LENLPRCGQALNSWTDNQGVTLRMDTSCISLASQAPSSHVKRGKSIVAPVPSRRRGGLMIDKRRETS